jgi:hypothetical protein
MGAVLHPGAFPTPANKRGALLLLTAMLRGSGNVVSPGNVLIRVWRMAAICGAESGSVVTARRR